MNAEQNLPSRYPRLSWYLVKFLNHEVTAGFLYGVFIFMMILLLFQAVRIMEFVVMHQVAIMDVLRLSGYLLLSFVPLVVPIAFLFAVLLGVSRANSEGEILAMQVSGISLRQIYAPIGIFSVFLSGVVLYLALYLVPYGNRAFELLFSRLGSERVIATLKPGVFIEGFYGLVLFTEHIVPLKNELKRVYIYDKRDPTRPLAISAQAGILKNQPEKGILTLRLTNGSIHIENKDTELLQQKIGFDVYDINLEMAARGDGWRAHSMESFTLPLLTQHIRDSEHNTPHHRRLLVEYHKRFSLALLCFVFGALGFALGISSNRGARSSSIVSSLVIAMGYWTNYLLVNYAAAAGWLPAWFGMWLPNFAFLAFAYYRYRRYVGG